MKDLVETLYADAGLDLEADLARIDGAPRIAASDYALDFWSEPGRTVTGDIQIPVIRMHMLGDNAIPYSLMYGYQDLVEEQGRDDLYRQVLVRSAGHCEFTPAESTAAVEALVERLETGTWPDTSPDALNALAEALETGTEARFMSDEAWRITATTAHGLQRGERRTFAGAGVGRELLGILADERG